MLVYVLSRNAPCPVLELHEQRTIHPLHMVRLRLIGLLDLGLGHERDARIRGHNQLIGHAIAHLTRHIAAIPKLHQVSLRHP